MSKPIIFLFSGQGSQFFKMGMELFENQPLFSKWMLKLDDIAAKLIGNSVISYMYDKKKPKSEVFDRTLYSNPAIFMIEYALAQVFIEKGVKPDYVLGTSLGEYASAAIADVLSYEECLELLIKQAKILEAHSQKGGMLAIFENYDLYDNSAIISDNSELVTKNSNLHFVISGASDKLKLIQDYLDKKVISYMDLPVSIAFHSPLINSSKSMYTEILKEISPRKPKIPFMSSVSGDVLTEIQHDYFWDVLRKPILFREAIHKLEQGQGAVYLDLGPSGTLATFAKYNIDKDSKSESFAVLTPFSRDLKGFEKVESYLIDKKLIIKNEKENSMKTFVFPGQGSQKKGMGKGLFDEFKDETAKADKILGYSVKELCLNDPDNQLGFTQFTQPALYIVNALTWLKVIADGGGKPDYVAGHSLGEYNALFASGAFSFETGVELVKKRGELMSLATGGGMGAIIGLNEDEVNTILKDNGFSEVAVANYNSPFQLVISGPKAEIDRATPIFKASKARAFIPLKVSAAFHSPFMESAKMEFAKFLEQFEFSELTIPVISNISARPYKQEDLKNNIIEQITHSVKWTDSIRYLMGKGGMAFEEIGPGSVLKSLIAKIKTEAEPLIVDESEEKQDSVPTQDSSKIESKECGAVDNTNGGKTFKITAGSLGDDEFKKRYNLKYAYVTGGMYMGIASKDIVVKVAKAGMVGYLGTGGVKLEKIEEDIKYIKRELSNGEAYGINLLNSPKEAATVDLYLKHGVRNIEAAAYMQMTLPIVLYRLKGLSRGADGSVTIDNKIMAKVSRPEVAEHFFSPAPDRILKKLLEANSITKEQAELSKEVPMADEICVEADSGGHTDQGVAYALMPAMLKLREEMAKKYNYKRKVMIGAAGGIGAPEAAAAAFILGADFVLTGSINQCTVEAQTSDVVKDLLEQINVQDTTYAPAGDMFELGAKVQVVRKGVFFPARANKLYALYQQYNSLDEIDEKTQKQLQERYFKRTFDEIYNDCKEHHSPDEISRAEKNPKQKMAMVFKWYFWYSTQMALKGDESGKVDFQIQCGPSLGAFNQWLKGTELESWKNRHVDVIGEKLMVDTAEVLNQRFSCFSA